MRQAYDYWQDQPGFYRCTHAAPTGDGGTAPRQLTLGAGCPVEAFVFAHSQHRETRGLEARVGRFGTLPPRIAARRQGTGSGSLLGIFPHNTQAADTPLCTAFAAGGHLHGAVVRRVARVIPSPAALTAAGGCTPAGLCCLLPEWRCCTQYQHEPTAVVHRTALAACIARQHVVVMRLRPAARPRMGRQQTQKSVSSQC